MIDKRFLAEFKQATEAERAGGKIEPSIFGFQFQRGTRWLPGLSGREITAYEHAVGAVFPNDLKQFLREMNGTDLPTVNVYGSSGEPHRQAIGVYSYPRDLELVRDQISTVQQYRAAITNDLARQGFNLGTDSKLVPIYSHRHVVSTQDPDSSVVLSIVVNDVDAIVYGDSLQEYLTKEFLVG